MDTYGFAINTGIELKTKTKLTMLQRFLKFYNSILNDIKDSFAIRIRNKVFFYLITHFALCFIQIVSILNIFKEWVA